MWACATPERRQQRPFWLPGVISYRDIRDTDEMIAAAERYKHAVVIGGGLLGLEAANGLALSAITPGVGTSPGP